MSISNLLRISPALISLLFATAPLADAKKFTINGDTVLYDTSLAEAEEDQEINWDDAETLEELLRKNSDVKVLHLESYGGLTEAAQHIADVVIDYELDTYVDGECSSACVTIFLGGEKRTLARGSWLGFHKTYWSSESMKEYYESEKEEEEWESPFEFSEWVYADTQEQILKDFEYMLERGVTPAFAIKTLRADSDDMWYPRRKELVAAGVVNDTSN